MNLASACRPSSAWYALDRSTTSNQMGSLRKWLLSPNRTSSRTRPMGEQERPGTMPWKTVRVGSRSSALRPSLVIVSRFGAGGAGPNPTHDPSSYPLPIHQIIHGHNLCPCPNPLDTHIPMELHGHRKVSMKPSQRSN